jgi:hypothetical protein
VHHWVILGEVICSKTEREKRKEKSKKVWPPPIEERKKKKKKENREPQFLLPKPKGTKSQKLTVCR